ncbi:cell division protein ZapA [candidate division KSB1 bacterium]|nr:cell division protein ZapA [candidate division KSB1 bacterium]
MRNDDNILKVRIFGYEYPLKSNANIQYIRKVADYVDAKMNEVQRAKPNRPLHQIAILAAMNITDELLQQREIERKRVAQLETQVTELTKRLEDGFSDLEDREP